jgi:hypothetical protein
MVTYIFAYIALTVMVIVFLVWIGHNRAVIPALFHPSKRLEAPLVPHRTSYLDSVTDQVMIYVAEVQNERAFRRATFVFEQTWYIWALVSALFHPSKRLGAPLVLPRIA